MIRKLSLSILCVLLCKEALGAEEPQLSKTKIEGLEHPLVCHVGDPRKCSIAVSKGEKVPFDGILQTNYQAAELAVRADPKEIQKRVDLEKKTVQDLAYNDLQLERKLRTIDNEAWEEKLKKTEEHYQKEIDRLDIEFYEHPAFVASVSALVTLGLVAGAVAIADGLRDSN